MLFRTASLAAMALLGFVLPVGLGFGRRLALAAILLAIAGTGLVIEKYFPRHRVNLGHTVSDIVICVLVITVSPFLWTAAVVVCAGVLAAAIPTQQTKTIITLLLLSAGALSIVGMAVGQDRWQLPIAAMVCTVPSFDAFQRMSQNQGDITRLRYDALVDAAPVFFWEVELATDTFVSVAGNSELLIGRAPDDLVGTSWYPLLDDSEAAELEKLAHVETEEQVAIVGSVRHADGRNIPFRHVVRWGGDGVLRGMSTDITELEEAARTIRYQAEHDALTGLANRTVLGDLLAAHVPQATLEDPLAVLTLDLNRFKEVNDTLGHPVGDELLQVISKRLSEELGGADLVARVGGDEFAVVLVTDVTRERAVEVARRVVELVERKLRTDRVLLSVSPAVGIVMAPEHGDTPELLLQRADIAMYQAKRDQKPLVVYEATPEDFTVERLQLSSSISEALENDEFELFFQPKLDLETKAIVGAEGLARWRHPERGVLSPVDFLELINLAGEYHRFTDRVLEQGFVMAATCLGRGTPVDIAVNMSSFSFFDGELPDRLSGLFDDYAVPPGNFTIEITEADILDEAGAYIGVFDELHHMGVGISIDDFGTGHSSLVRLRQLPVTEIKLDRSFVSKLQASDEDMVIVKTVIELAKSLGHRTVAEGVETEEVAEILRTLGCEHVQGYLYARPMPVDEFIAFIDGWPHGVGSHGVGNHGAGSSVPGGMAR